MPAFTDSNQLATTLRGFFTELAAENDATFSGSGVVAAFTLSDPDARVVLDGSVPPAEGRYFGVHVNDDAAPQPQVELFTDSETFDKLLRGEAQVMTLMMTGKLKSKGDVTKAMALMPAMSKAVPLYAAYRQQHG